MALFCSACGKIVNGKYCRHCGQEADKDTKPLDREKPPSFSEFYRSKSNDRVSKYAKRKKNDQKEKDEVVINVSFLLPVKVILVQERGSPLPVKANVNWSPSQLGRAIFNKFKRYNSTVKKLDLSDVKLVNKDGERVQYIPGTTTPFTLKEYKKDLGVAYQAIVLYLLPYEDRSDSGDELDETDKRLPHFL